MKTSFSSAIFGRRLLGNVLATVALAAGGFAAESKADETRLLDDTDARIQRNRTAALTVEVRDAQGRGVSGAKVQVEHVRHRFFFGAAADPVGSADRLFEKSRKACSSHQPSRT